MLIETLLVDLGSTKTLVTALEGLSRGHPQIVAQGLSATSIQEGDVCLGLERAVDDLRGRLRASRLGWKKLMATSSAAGGLRIAAHGLVPSMTGRAAREAALGAGGVLVSETNGRLTQTLISEIINKSPQIVLLAGGVDHGESEIILHNAAALAALKGTFSVLYAGNCALIPEVKRLFAFSKTPLHLTENVYPAIDKLNVSPARSLIQRIFEKNLIHSKGMERLSRLLDEPPLPTPRAVMLAAETLAAAMGDLMVFDVGGATTDVHSVTKGSPELSQVQLEPQTEATRTVEGDLGIFVNAENVYRLRPRFAQERFTGPRPQPVPRFAQKKEEKEFLAYLTRLAVRAALLRHVGQQKRILIASGEKEVIQGKDLTQIKWIIGTGGGLARLPHGLDALRSMFDAAPEGLLLPQGEVKFAIDRGYVLAGAGLIARQTPELAVKIMKDSLKV